MGFVKTYEEIAAYKRESYEFINAEIVFVFWETKPEIIARLLPSPLEPTGFPMAMAFLAWYPETNFDVSYHESALFLRASYKGEEGHYCLAMPVTNGIAMAGGREQFGFPKKMADVQLKKNTSTIRGWTERLGTRFMEMKATLSGKFNSNDLQQHLIGVQEDGSTRAVSWLFKHFPAPDGIAYDYNPRLIRQESLLRPKEMQIGEAEIILKPSNTDPWAEIEVVRTLGVIYMIGDNSMLGGTVVAEVEPSTFEPYSFLKWDMR